ncbi:YdcH family protein [Vulgatibacter sp.]|uniref:YdcH family protein n=1 Tax=Vulgatibacter sp. TaxID=1971226 RepID=UPI0035686626
MSAKISALLQRHADFENQLRSYEKRHYLTPAEAAEVKRLKLSKLKTKDELRKFSEMAQA